MSLLRHSPLATILATPHALRPMILAMSKQPSDAPSEKPVSASAGTFTIMVTTFFLLKPVRHILAKILRWPTTGLLSPENDLFTELPSAFERMASFRNHYRRLSAGSLELMQEFDYALEK